MRRIQIITQDVKDMMESVIEEYLQLPLNSQHREHKLFHPTGNLFLAVLFFKCLLRLNIYRLTE
jgi:hypothetical protein